MLSSFASSIQIAGAALNHCLGFIDGIARPIAYPVLNQEVHFRRYKKIHCLKYHAAVTPDGIIAHSHGPVAGRHHDNYSNMLDNNAYLPYEVQSCE